MKYHHVEVRNITLLIKYSFPVINGLESSIIRKLSNTGFDLNIFNKSCLLDSY